MTLKRTAGIVCGIILTGLYAYLVVAAVGNVVGMAAFLGDFLSPSAWVTLVAGIAIPVIVYAAALVIGRRRSGAVKLLVLATGLCLAAAMQLDLLHLMG